jgi:hypothetical protein
MTYNDSKEHLCFSNIFMHYIEAVMPYFIIAQRYVMKENASKEEVINAIEINILTEFKRTFNNILEIDNSLKTEIEYLKPSCNLDVEKKLSDILLSQLDDLLHSRTVMY